jgi:hypothetical protein
MNALQWQLTGLSVRCNPRGHGAADLHRARRHDGKRVLGLRVAIGIASVSLTRSYLMTDTLRTGLRSEPHPFAPRRAQTA